MCTPFFLIKVSALPFLDVRFEIAWREEGRPKKTIGKTIERYLELNCLYGDIFLDKTLWCHLIHVADPTQWERALVVSVVVSLKLIGFIHPILSFYGPIYSNLYVMPNAKIIPSNASQSNHLHLGYILAHHGCLSPILSDAFIIVNLNNCVFVL